MAGVEIHAHLTSQIISQVLDNRSSIQTLSEPIEYAWIIVWWMMGTIIVLVTRQTKAKRFRFWLFAVMTGGLIAVSALFGTTYVAFLQSWWLLVVPPLIVIVITPATIMTYEAYRVERIRNTFGRYLSREVVNALLEHPQGLKLGGESKTVTILVADIRAFTTISVKLSPEKVVKILNLFLKTMADVIVEYGGTIDEFMGDGILALFGAPLSREDDAERAVAAAIAMQLAMKSVNEQIQTWGFPNLEMGIGINTDRVVVGNIGSEVRSKYGVVGHGVNLAYRIESYTVGGQVLISENTLEAIGELVEVCSSRQVTPKGVTKLLTIYEAIAINGKHKLCLAQEPEIFVTLPEAVKIQYFLLRDKDPIDACSELGSIVKLSSLQSFLSRYYRYLYQSSSCRSYRWTRIYWFFD